MNCPPISHPSPTSKPVTHAKLVSKGNWLSIVRGMLLQDVAAVQPPPPSPISSVWGNKTALHRAVESQHIPLTEALIIHGTEVTAEHLIEAAHSGNHHLLRVLLTRPKEVNMNERFNGEVALCVSIWKVHHHCSRLLIKMGPDVNALTNYGEKTLLGSMAHGAFELVKLLLKKGVHINVINAQGQNAHTYNLAQNLSVHLDIKCLLAVAGEFCFTVMCNGQNFVQKYTPTGVSLIPVQQDRPYARKV